MVERFQLGTVDARLDEEGFVVVKLCLAPRVWLNRVEHLLPTANSGTASNADGTYGQQEELHVGHFPGIRHLVDATV